jgi:hypothetical protein
VLHQATTLGLDYVLYVVAINTMLISVCLVKVTAEQRAIFAASIVKWAVLVDWAHDCVEESGPPPTPSHHFNDQDAYILSTHVRLWRALKKLLAASDCALEPVHIFKSFGQVMYNKLKGGIDGSTWFVAAITGKDKPNLNLNMEQRIVLRAMKHVLINTAIFERCVQQVDSGWETLTQFRKKVSNNADSISSFAHDLAKDLAAQALSIRHKATVAHTRAAGGAPSETELSCEAIAEVTEQGSSQKRRKAITDCFNKGNPKKVRLGKGIHMKHIPKQFGTRETQEGVNKGTKTVIQRMCMLCGGHSASYCGTCGVTLHTTRTDTNANVAPCFARWHSLQQVLPGTST